MHNDVVIHPSGRRNPTTTVPAQEASTPHGCRPYRKAVEMTERDTGPEAGAKGVVEDVKGKAKEAAGRVFDDESLRREGEAQQDKAAAQRDVAEREAEAEKARAEAGVHEARERSEQR